MSNIEHAITAALNPLKNHVDGAAHFRSATNYLTWLQYHVEAPATIIAALQDAGFAIVPIGGDVPVTTTLREMQP